MQSNTVVNFPTKEIVYLDVNKIKVNPNQPRKFFSLDGITELSNSIHEHGILVPLSIRYTKGNYELIAGERRLRASKMANLSEIPCIIIDADTEQSQVLAVIENLQREDLNFIEEAEAFQSLLRDHGYTQDMLAKKICKNQSTIANKLRLLKLEDSVKSILIENNLTERHARALLKLPDEKSKLEVLSTVLKKSLNVSKTELLIENKLNSSNLLSPKELEERRKRQKVKMIIKDVKIFVNQIRLAVETIKSAGINASYEVNQSSTGYNIVVNIDKSLN